MKSTAAKAQEYRQRWIQKNPDYHYAAHPHLEHIMEWNRNNKDKVRLNQRRWRKNNKEKISNYQKKWRLKNRDKVNAYARNWRMNNKEKLNAYQREYQRYYRKKTAARLLLNQRKKGIKQI